MLSQWIVLVIPLLLIAATIQSEYDSKSSTLLSGEPSNFGLLTGSKSTSALAETNKLSNDHDVSLESSSSSTFFKNEQRKSTNVTKYQVPSIVEVIKLLWMGKETERQLAPKNLSVLSDIDVPVINQDSNWNPIRQRQIMEDINSFDEVDYEFPTKGRMKRGSIYPPGSWIRYKQQRTAESQDPFQMHAYIVKDENIPPCCTVADPVSQTRYFMCSGAILTLKHAITTASCVHFADVYEHHISADLAVLVSAFTLSPYVIKVTRFEMHPNYVFDVSSADNPTHNLAVLFLSCSFTPSSVVVPKLPQGLYDDVGHMCCGRQCAVTTIVQSFDNHHVAKILEARNLPRPLHDYPATRWGNGLQFRPNKSLRDRSSSSHPRVRRSGKLAGVPSFLFKDLQPESTIDNRRKAVKPLNQERKRVKNIFDEIASVRRASTSGNTSLHKESRPTTKNARGKSPVFQKSKSIEKDLPKVDWKNVEEKLGEKIVTDEKVKMNKFANSLIDETIKRLDSVLYDIKGKKKESSRTLRKNPHSGKDDSFLMSHLPNSTSSNIGDVANVFAKIIKSVLPPQDNNKLSVLSDLTVDEEDIPPPPPKNENCPPLGTPIIEDGILVGMVAYTCDDYQDWVEWKYVSMSKNTNWIHKTISSGHQSQVDCGSSTVTPYEGTVEDDSQSMEHDPIISERKLREFIPEIQKQYKESTEEYTKQLPKQIQSKHPSVYNPDRQPVQYHQPMVRPPSPSPATPSKNSGFSAVSNINANTCFTKPDGSTDCRSITNTYTVQ